MRLLTVTAKAEERVSLQHIPTAVTFLSVLFWPRFFPLPWISTVFPGLSGITMDCRISTAIKNK